jgi:hypothetical protein
LYFAHAYPIKKPIVFQGLSFSKLVGVFAHPLYLIF